MAGAKRLKVQPVSGDEGNVASSVRTIELDEAIYPADVVQKALYWISDRAAGRLDSRASGRIAVTLRLLDSTVDLEALESEFYAHLTDFSVRRQVNLETRTIRELIFTKALAASGALEDPVPGDDRDPVEQASDDPDAA